MPEGDTIFRAARTLDAVLAGRTVTGLRSPRAGIEGLAHRFKVVGSQVERVEARGKHLLMRFSGGAVLHTHMRMHGSWHTYRRQTRWRKPAHAMRVVVEAGDVIAVCFDAPVVELLGPGEAARHPALAGLGTDLLATDFDLARAVAALRARGAVEIGIALLDQRSLAGIGNVYKSEVLFLCGVNPFGPVAALDDATLASLVATAARELRRNTVRSGRRTTPGLSGPPLSVYRRAGEPCLRCGAAIERRLQGEQGRSTYWCPGCQPVV
jgi:endonuclease-8